jgi:hypothetical protein
LPGAFVFETDLDRESTSDNRLARNGTNVWTIYKGGRKIYRSDVAAGVAYRRLIDARHRMRCLFADRYFVCLSFPKIPSGRIRALRENQGIIRRDACHAPSAWDVCRQPFQVVAPA